MLGIGRQRAGRTGAGLGEAGVAPPPPIPAQGAPFLTSEGNYVIDPASGDIGRMPSARHQVLLALQTVGASATADTSLGENKPTKIGTSFAANAEASVRRALQPLVERRIISLDGVSVTVSRSAPGTVERVVSYTDLLNQAADKVTV